MASRIPIAADVRKVAPAQLPALNVRAESFGSQPAQGLEQAGAAALALNLKIMDRDAETNAKRADGVLSKRIRERLFGNDDGKNPENADEPGYYSRQQDNAVNDRELATSDIQRYYDELVENMDRRVRTKFDASALRRLNSAFEGIGRHSLKEKTAVELAVSLAREEQATADAIASAGTPDALMFANTAAEEAAGRLRKTGAKPPMIKYEKQKALTKAHVGIIKRLLERPGGAIEAGNWYQKYKVDILGTERADLEKLIKGGTLLQRAQELSDDVMNLYEGLHDSQATYPNAKGNEAYAMSLARKGRTAAVEKELKKSPELRKAVAALVKARIAEKVSFEKADQRELRLSAIRKITDGKTEDVTIAEKAALLNTPGGATYLLTGSATAEAQKAGRTGQGDVEYLGKLAGMNDHELAEVDLTTPDAVRKTGKYHSTWLTRQRSAQEAIRQGTNNARTPRMIGADTAKLINNKVKRHNFRIQYDAALQAATQGQKKGYVLPADQAQVIADKLMLEMVKEVAFWPDTEKDRFEIPSTELQKLKADGKGPLWTINTELSDDPTKTNVDELARILGLPETKVELLFKLMKDRDTPVTLKTLTAPLTSLEELRGDPERLQSVYRVKRHRQWLARILDYPPDGIPQLVEIMLSNNKKPTLENLMFAADGALGRKR